MFTRRGQVIALATPLGKISIHLPQSDGKSWGHIRLASYPSMAAQGSALVVSTICLVLHRHGLHPQKGFRQVIDLEARKICAYRSFIYFDTLGPALFEDNELRSAAVARAYWPHPRKQQWCNSWSESVDSGITHQMMSCVDMKFLNPKGTGELSCMIRQSS